MESLQGLLSEHSLFMTLCPLTMSERGKILCFKLQKNSRNKRFIIHGQGMNISCHQSDGGETVCHRSAANMLPAVMPRCVLIKGLKDTRFPKRAWWELAGLLSPSLSFPLTSVFLSTYLRPSPLNANTNQHFMCPGAVKQPL